MQFENVSIFEDAYKRRSELNGRCGIVSKPDETLNKLKILMTNVADDRNIRNWKLWLSEKNNKGLSR